MHTTATIKAIIIAGQITINASSAFSLSVWSQGSVEPEFRHFLQSGKRPFSSQVVSQQSASSSSHTQVPVAVPEKVTEDMQVRQLMDPASRQVLQPRAQVSHVAVAILKYPLRHEHVLPTCLKPALQVKQSFSVCPLQV